MTHKRNTRIGLLLATLALALSCIGCDTLYATPEGIGTIGPNGGSFVCYDEASCSGTPG